MYSYRNILVFLQKYTCIPTEVYLHSYRNILVFLQKYTCIPTEVYMYSYRSILVFLQKYTCIPTEIDVSVQTVFILLYNNIHVLKNHLQPYYVTCFSGSMPMYVMLISEGVRGITRNLK